MCRTITILGATGHVGNILVYYLSQNKNYRIICLVRSINKMRDFLNKYIHNNNIDIYNISNFYNINHDIIINCLGFGNPEKLKDNVNLLFKLTEEYDNLIIEYLLKNKKCIYLNFSSGAVYGNQFLNGADLNSTLSININNELSNYYYTIVKLNSEAKHRSLYNLNIIDFRIFALYSRFIDLNYKFFMTEIIYCLKNNLRFQTNNIDFIRDFVHPSDLSSLVELFFNFDNVNDSFDVYSLSPISKFEILSLLGEKYGLKYDFVDSKINVSPTGIKKNYYSTYKGAQRFGYEPKFKSEETITKETEFIIDMC